MNPLIPSRAQLVRRRSIAVAGAATLALGIAACGSSDNKSKSSATTPAIPEHSVDRGVVRTLPLHLTMAAVVAKLGQPQSIEHNVGVLPDKKSKGLGHHKPSKNVRTVPIIDYIYGVKGGKPTDSVDLTFYKGKLSSVLIKTAESAAAAAATPGAAP